MTKTHKTILFIYILALFLGATIPYLFCWNEKLKWSLDIARTISIISASILALLYFDPFGIRKGNLAKQHDNVILILEKTFTQRLLVKIESSKPYAMRMFSQNFMTTKHLEFILKDDFAKEYLDYPVLLNIENFIEQTRELAELKNSLFTPKSISEKMVFLEFSMATKSKKKHDNYSIVAWGRSENNDPEKLYNVINNKELTLKELFINYQKLITECISWLEKNSFSTKQLNIK